MTTPTDPAVGPAAECLECGSSMVMSHRKWKRLTSPDRERLRARGISAHHGHGLCEHCYPRSLRPTRTTTSRGIVLAEWEAFASPRFSQKRNAQIVAEALGVSWQSIERAISRAKKDGVLDG